MVLLNQEHIFVYLTFSKCICQTHQISVYLNIYKSYAWTFFHKILIKISAYNSHFYNISKINLKVVVELFTIWNSNLQKLRIVTWGVKKRSKKVLPELTDIHRAVRTGERRDHVPPNVGFAAPPIALRNIRFVKIMNALLWLLPLQRLRPSHGHKIIHGKNS